MALLGFKQLQSAFFYSLCDNARCFPKDKVLHFGKALFSHQQILQQNPVCGSDDELHGLTNEERIFRREVFDLCRSDLAPYVEEIDQHNGWDKQKLFWRKLGEMGLFGVTVPRKYGGLGRNIFHQCVAFEEMSRVSAAMAVSYGAQSNLCVNQLALNGNEEQKRRFFPKLLSGEHVGALAMSEVGSGSDVVSMQLRADKCGHFFVLNGHKFWISNGPDADVVIVYARTKHDGPAEHGLTTFIVERGMEGFSAMPKLDKLGMRGSNTGELVFEDCKVPMCNIIGKVNGGIYVLFKGLDIERALLAAGSLGLMQACVDTMAELNTLYKDENTYESSRIKEKLSNMHTTLSVCRSYTYSVVRAIDAGFLSSKDCAGCVLYSSERATRMAMDVMECYGLSGYSRYHTVGRLMCDAKLNEIGGGTNEIRRWLIGRRINEDYATK